jgi:5-deoxy-glucuronate isomerase
MSGSSLLKRSQGGESGPLLSITPVEAGWTYSHFQAYRLTVGKSLQGSSDRLETALIVLGGRCTIIVGSNRYESIGDRRDVWEKRPPYVLLLPPGLSYEVVAETELHLAVAAAPAEAEKSVPRLIRPDEIVVEERGEGQTYRYIQHLLPPSTPAARLILVEVYTPGGNWSSFPPHKHDTEVPPEESYLEEIYYYQVKPATGFAIQRVYTDDRSLDEVLAPGNGDAVLVPRGYHPVAATPGHDCYYLNVMAGPTRSWNFRVDADYAHLMNWKKPDVTKG